MLGKCFTTELITLARGGHLGPPAQTSRTVSNPDAIQNSEAELIHRMAHETQFSKVTVVVRVSFTAVKH